MKPREMLKPREMIKEESKCTEEHAPKCQASCPIHLDMREIIAHVKIEDFAGAMEIFQRGALFPRIIAKACDAPCQNFCRRVDVEESIAINKIEQVLIKEAEIKPTKKMPYMQLKKKAAIIGAGISGLTATVYLYEKGFKVTIFEKEPRLGGNLWNLKNLTAEDIEKDLDFILNSQIKIEFEREIGKDISFNDLEQDYDAIYFSGSSQLLAQILDLESKLDPLNSKELSIIYDPKTGQTSNPKVFVGGSILRDQYSLIQSMAEGKRAAVSMDRFLKNVSLTASRINEEAYKTKLFTSIEGIPEKEQVKALHSKDGYSIEEAIAEASRCLDCHCLECVKQCRYLEKFEKFPRQYIREISNNITIVGGYRRGNDLINSCSLCGLCTEICPNNIEMERVCRSARNNMVASGKMPERIHDFPIRDMQFSNSDEFAFYRHQPHMDQSNYLFFPGCQLAAGAPHYILPVYQYLMENLAGGVGLMLGCCGAPADWSGNESLFQETLAKFKDIWLSMGSPQVITACTTCYKNFQETIPEMDITHLWQVYQEKGLPDIERAKGRIIAIHDPCTTRHDELVHDNIRSILKDAGYQVEELKYSKSLTKCCGYGGLVFYGNKDLAGDIIESRIQESPKDYLTYCWVCRDYLVKGGKKTHHILDVIYGQDDPKTATQIGSDISQKRFNRRALKRQLLKNIWGDKVETRINDSLVDVIITEDVKKIMEDRLILVEEITEVINLAEKTKRIIIRPSDQHLFAHEKLGIVTYWVEYSKVENSYIVHNAYSHRVEILEEQVNQ